MKESHFIDMMRVVQPHTSGRPKRSIELLIQSADLLFSMQQYREPELFACDTSQNSIDFEATLTDLQSVCTPPEAELINLILNFFRSRKIYSAYRAASQPIQKVQASPTISPEYGTDNTNTTIKAESNHPITDSSKSTSTDHAKEPQPSNTANTFRNFMENPALQSFLSPSQKENLNQIGTFMKAIS